MSRSDREKWDARYAAGAYADRTHPSDYLAEWLPRLPRGKALDLACGAGRNTLYLAAQGWQVDGVDISPVALERGRRAAVDRGLTDSIRFIEADLERDRLPATDYDLIVCIRYLDLALFAKLERHLVPGGHVLLEQHLATEKAEVVGPHSAAFRVAAGALSRCLAGLDLVDSFEGLITDPDGRPAALARAIAYRPAEAERSPRK